MIKSNMNNWISCVDGSGSLVYWIDGSVKCKLVKNYSGMCSNVVPNFLTVSEIQVRSLINVLNYLVSCKGIP